MLIVIKYALYSIYLISFVSYLLLQFNSEIYFRRTAGEPSTISFDQEFYEYRTSCVYQWHQYHYQLPNCDSLELGQKYHLIGRVSGETDKFIFYQKKLDIQSIEQLSCCKSSVKTRWQVCKLFLFASRTRLLKFILNAFNSPEGRMMAAVLTGNKSTLSEEQRHLIEVTGMQHAFAVSGQHLGMIITACKPLCSRFWRTKAALPLVVIAWMLAWLLGGSASLIRAALMVTYSLYAVHRWHRPVCSWRLLFLVVITMLWLHPWWLVDVGFQLTVAAMSGVILSQSLLQEISVTKHLVLNFSLSEGDSNEQQSIVSKIRGYIRETVVTTIVITLLIAPLTLWYFQTVSLLSVVANVLVLWLFPAILTSAALVLFCYVLIYLAPFLEIVVTSLLWVLELPTLFASTILAWLAQFEGLVFHFKLQSTWLVLTYYLLFIAIWRLFVHRKTNAYFLAF